MIVAYLRVSRDKQDCENQKTGIVAYSQRLNLAIDQYHEEKVSGKVKAADRSLGGIMESMKPGDILIVSELARVGRSFYDIMRSLQFCMEGGVEVHAVKEGMVFSDNLQSKVMAAVFGIAAEIERSMISLRTKEGLAMRKMEGKILGRPAGKSKLDPHRAEIESLLQGGATVLELAEKFNTHRETMGKYVKRCR
jgi:DNA invertase Pin-like site-specific DNA recombinase